jgi:hypothetical protein
MGFIILNKWLVLSQLINFQHQFRYDLGSHQTYKTVLISFPNESQ